MTTPVDFNEFTNKYPESEVVALKEHVASGAPSIWVVHTIEDAGERFDTYQEANKRFNELPASKNPSLILYTRVGTSVTFRYKEA